MSKERKTTRLDNGWEWWTIDHMTNVSISDKLVTTNVTGPLSQFTVMTSQNEHNLPQSKNSSIAADGELANGRAVWQLPIDDDLRPLMDDDLRPLMDCSRDKCSCASTRRHSSSIRDFSISCSSCTLRTYTQQQTTPGTCCLHSRRSAKTQKHSSAWRRTMIKISDGSMYECFPYTQSNIAEYYDILTYYVGLHSTAVFYDTLTYYLRLHATTVFYNILTYHLGLHTTAVFYHKLTYHLGCTWPQHLKTH